MSRVMKNSESSFVSAKMGLDGLWHAVHKKPCGALESLASGPCREAALAEGRERLAATLWPKLHPFQYEVMAEVMKASDEGRPMVLSGGRLAGKNTVRKTIAVLRSRSLL